MFIINGIFAGFIPNVGSEKVEVVDLDTAKLLREQGFDRPTHYYWQDKSLPFSEGGLKRVNYNKRRLNHNKYDDWLYSAPTRGELLKWLRSNSKK
jgi:hypothetical protein